MAHASPIWPKRPVPRCGGDVYHVPQRVVFAEGAQPTMLKTAVQAKAEGICQPILLGSPDRLNRVASRLKLDLSDIEIIDNVQTWQGRH